MSLRRKNDQAEKIAVVTRDSETFPKLLKEVRRQPGLSLAKPAHELGVSSAGIGCCDDGRTSFLKLESSSFKVFCHEKVSSPLLSMEQGKQ